LGWEPVADYERRIAERYQADHVDPIFRYSRERDVVDPKRRLVWDHPLKSDVKGNFSTARVWYVAHQFQDSDRSQIDPEAVDRYYLYVRTFDLSNLTLPSLTACHEELWKRWVPQIEAEYDGKESMDFE